MKKLYQLLKFSLAAGLLFLVCFSPQAGLARSFKYQQTVVVSGTVKDAEGVAMPGVNIYEKGTTNGTTSDATGNYRVNVSSSNAVLVFSFVGTETKEVTVNGQSEISVTLAPTAETLAELVVIGYGTQKRSDVTGAITSVKRSEER